jgi:hypothetical protein
MKTLVIESGKQNIVAIAILVDGEIRVYTAEPGATPVKELVQSCAGKSIPLVTGRLVKTASGESWQTLERTVAKQDPLYLDALKDQVGKRSRELGLNIRAKIVEIDL